MQQTTKSKLIRIGSNLGIFLVLAALLAITTMHEIQNVFSNNDNQPYYSGNTKNPNLSLMINVYWGNEYLGDMLDTLANEEVKATFFIGGNWASKYDDLLQQIVARGHEIGNHGFFHKDHKSLNYEQNQNEIYNTHSLIKELTGLEMTLFAPPSGSFNKTTLQVAGELGYKTIMWSKDTIDWRDKDRSVIYNRAIKNPKNGDLILMHPTEATALALGDIIKFYKNNGFNVVTVSQNIA